MNEKTTTYANGEMFAYSKLAYHLDVAEVIWPLVNAIAGAGISSTDKLLEAYLDGTIGQMKAATKRGMKQVGNLLCNLYSDKREEVIAVYRSIA